MIRSNSITSGPRRRAVLIPLTGLMVLASAALAAPVGGPVAGNAAAGGGGDVDPAAAGETATSMPSVWELALDGGVMMIPIALASFVAFAVTVERLIVLRRRRVIPSNVLEQVRPHLPKPGGSPKAAVDFCMSEGSPVARVIAGGLRRLGSPLETIERHIAESGERESLELRRRLRVLAVVAAIAPLMGLLGTILGMIDAFRTVASAGDALGRTELLAEGIYEAMITTAGGLMVAIPALLAYHWLTSKVQRLVMEMDGICVDLVEHLVEAGQVATAATAPKPAAVVEVAPASPATPTSAPASVPANVVNGHAVATAAAAGTTEVPS